MTDSFTASPGTFVITYDPETPSTPDWTPVVGWTRGLSGFDPVTIIPEDGLMVFGKAIQLMDTDREQIVVDPVAKKTFYTVDDWVAYMRGAKPVAKPNKQTGVSRRVNLFVQFGKKSYVNRSYWHFKTPGDEFLFELGGSMEAPEDPRVTKINREAYFRARKLIEAVPYDELFNTTQEPGDPDPNPDEEVESLL